MEPPVEIHQSREIETLAVLADPVRHALYELVVSFEPGDLSRDQAGEALGIRRGLAAFHLDKLTEAGLLQTLYRRPPGVGGPGAGRPTKFYRRSSGQIDVSIPQRRYDLMGRFLADAISRMRVQSLPRARQAARGFGRELGAMARNRSGAPASSSRLIAAALAVLAEYGFQPVRRGRQGIILRNCPFHLLAVDYKDTVCQVNLALHEGVVESLGVTRLQAKLDPAPDRCCVSYQIGTSRDGRVKR
jgi:predicted ArsR family transcriptional regulator